MNTTALPSPVLAYAVSVVPPLLRSVIGTEPNAGTACGQDTPACVNVIYATASVPFWRVAVMVSQVFAVEVNV
jgi:hypothetical protein